MKCGIIGNRKIEFKNLLELKLRDLFENLINNEKVDTFIFGSKSEFDDLCWQIISDLQNTYNIEMINYFCGFEKPMLKKYKVIGQKYYDKINKPANVINAGKYLYIERNKAIINDSDLMVFYCNEKYTPDFTHSGTKIAYDYAIKMKKKCVNIYNLKNQSN